jgi:hypothetical protein
MPNQTPSILSRLALWSWPIALAGIVASMLLPSLLADVALVVSLLGFLVFVMVKVRD